MSENKPFITVYEAISGWKAQLLVLNEENPDIGSFWEPWQTSYFAYSTKEEAERDAKDWAEAEELEFKPS